MAPATAAKEIAAQVAPSNSSTAIQQAQPILKAIVVGEPNTGKTSIVRRFTQAHCDPNYKVTIGVDFFHRRTQASNGTTVQLQLWDIAGHERFNALTRIYFKEAKLCLLVCDVTNDETFKLLAKWRASLDQKERLEDGSVIPCMLLVNKSDIDKSRWKVTDEQIEKFCEQQNVFKWFYTSAKDDVNIGEAMRAGVDKVVNEQHLRRSIDPLPETVTLDQITEKVVAKPTRRCC